jgi:hypothetical protein
MNLKKDLKHEIAERLVSLISREMGYDFEQDRIERIAEMSIKLSRNGYATLWSTAYAFEHDFFLYGDPHAPVPDIKGFTNVLKEIYQDETLENISPKEEAEP